MQALYHPPAQSTRQVHVFDMAAAPWQATANAGLWLKPVRHDNERGLYLGLVRFDAGTRSGLHQHQGVATSFVLDGGLTDCHGAIGLHEAGINLKGSTHDAIAYRPTLLVSRLEGPVTYPPESDISGVHAGSRHAAIRNPAPDVAPEVNVPVDAQLHDDTGVPGVRRQLIFDYARTGSEHRMAQLSVRPETAFSFVAGALTEFWVRGGLLAVNGRAVHADCFIVCEEGAEVEVRSPYGALLIGWADGRELGGGNLFGF
ncbi:cupin domain-containing protein [Ramlibacter sp.]|uniref:cupin domain-containing protein n=1 Tax=Ramlibacter sp. TaxID=1917967 RepID=UPI001791FE28|nr:cupin domain-containing protein [Ramlibacter sp.]MBA2674619.1 cupin domain-containing protein [Ramlibacter sp.]